MADRKLPPDRGLGTPARAGSANDTQRGRVYEAENLVHRLFDRAVDFPIVDIAGSALTLPVERKFGSRESLQGYVDQLLALEWIRRRWPRASVPVTVRERAGWRSAHYERGAAVIAIPGTSRGDRWAMRELVVLHEVAHHLAGTDTEANHGPAYVGRLLELVGGVIGPEAELLLRVTFAENGVVAG